jgi:HAE1 family hydrophobic/amphiphilic exporter-1
MKRVVRFAVSHPVTISMVTVAAFVFGIVALGRLDVRLLPEVRYPSLTVQTEFPNTAPLDVEHLATRPLEEAVGVVPGLRRVHSISQSGLSQITLEFDWNTDMDYTALEVREKIDIVDLPDDAGTPLLLKYDPALDPVLRVGLWGDAPLTKLRTVAEDVVKREVESVQGVAAAKVEGGLEEEIQVFVDEAKLAAMGIPIGNVEAALREENINASGGRLRDRNAEYLVRTLSRFDSVEEILDVAVGARDGQSIKLADVATVQRGHKERTEITHVDGRESVEIAVYKEGDANIVDIAARVRERLERIGKELDDGTEMEVLFDQSVFISQAVDEVRNNALLGGLLAILILYVFLRDFRSTLIIGLSIPLSIVATFILMYNRGVSLNVMSLGGLALGVGMLVDNSIVVLEAIVRRRERAAGGDGGDGDDDNGDDAGREESVVDGASGVAGAVLASTLTTVAVFVPIVFVVEGISGQIFRDQALTVTFSLLVSLVVALTFAPMVAAVGARRRGRAGGAEEGRAGAKSWGDLVPPGRARWLRGIPAFLFVVAPVFLLGFLKMLARPVGWVLGRLLSPLTRLFEVLLPRITEGYGRRLAWALRNRAMVLGGSMALAVVALASFGLLGREVIPPLSQGELTLSCELPEGTPLSVTDQTVAELGRELRKIDGIDLVSANVGVSNEGAGSVRRQKENRADIHLKLARADGDSEDAVLEEVRKAFDQRPEVQMKVRRPSLLTFNTPIEVDVYGWDLDALMATAGSVSDEMAKVDGARDIRIGTVPGSPEIRVRFDRDKLSRLGLRLSEVSATVRDKVRGAVATRYRDRERHIDIRVQNEPDQRNTLSAIRELIVAERGGVPIRLGSIADMEIVRGPAEIHRLDGQRVAIVSANLAGRDLGSASEELAARVAGIALPAEVTLDLGGQNREMESSFRSLQLAILLAVFLVYLVMAAQFESFVYPFLIMFTVPLALVGAVLGLAVTGTSLSVIAGIGAIMLAGIVVNNGIVLVDRINQLRKHFPLEEAVLGAGRERLRPILMTTTTTVLGLLPMALGLGEGAELRAPLAITVISGLVFATGLTLFVVPAAYTLLTPGPRRPDAQRAAGRRPAASATPAAAAGS